MALPWFRLYTEFATDPKVQILPEEMQRRLVMLFCARGAEILHTLNDEELAHHLRISDEQLAQTKRLFVSKSFIDESWNLCNWDKRQPASDRSAARTRNYRDRRRNVTATSHAPSRDDPEADTETDGDGEHQEAKRARKVCLELPDWLEPEVWAEWHRYRNGRKGWTAKAQQLSLRTLQQLRDAGCCPREVIERSIERGWSGLFDPRNNKTFPVQRKAVAGKTMSALVALEDMKHELDTTGNSNGLPEAAVPWIGRDAGG